MYIYIYTYMEASRFKLISQRHDDPMFVIYRYISTSNLSIIPLTEFRKLFFVHTKLLAD